MGSENFNVITGRIDHRGTQYYHMVISAGKLPNGKRNRMSASTGLPLKGNSRKANAMLNDAISKLNQAREKTSILELSVLYELIQQYGMDDLPVKYASMVKEDNPPAADVVRQWLDYVDVVENTRNKYKYAGKHVIAYFAMLKIGIKELESVHIANYFTSKKNGDPKNGVKPLSAKTLRDHKTVIDGAIRYAIKILKVIGANPSADVKAPRVEIKSPSYFSESQLNDVLEKIQGYTIEAAVIITANYGLRKQETLGLKWDAVDMEKRTITVRHTVTQVGKMSVSADKTKTRKSLRTLPLTKKMLAYFKKLREHQEVMKSMFGPRYQANDYICKWQDGRPLRPGYVYSSWSSFLEEHGFPHITFHDLRHSSATMLFQLGFTIIEIQEWLGHSDISSTKRYIHTTYADKQKIADKVDMVLDIPGIDGYLPNDENQAENLPG